MGSPAFWRPLDVNVNVNDYLPVTIGATPYDVPITYGGTWYSPFEAARGITESLRAFGQQSGFLAGLNLRVLNEAGSADLSDTNTWGRAGISGVTATADSPFTGTRYFTVTENANTDYHELRTTKKWGANERLYVRVWAKPHTSAFSPCYFGIKFGEDSAGIRDTVQFNLTTGAVYTNTNGCAGRVTSWGSGWFMLEAWETGGATGRDPWYASRLQGQPYRNSKGIQLGILNATASEAYTGTSGNGVLLWDALVMKFGPRAGPDRWPYVSTMVMPQDLTAFPMVSSIGSIPKFMMACATSTWSVGGNVTYAARTVATDLGFDTATTGFQPIGRGPPMNLWVPGVAPYEDDGPSFEAVGSWAQAASGTAQFIEDGVFETREVTFQFGAERGHRWGEGRGAGWNTSAGSDLYTSTMNSLERFWRLGRGRFRYWPDIERPLEFGDYCFDERTSKGITFDRPYKGKNILRVKLRMRSIAT